MAGLGACSETRIDLKAPAGGDRLGASCRSARRSCCGEALGVDAGLGDRLRPDQRCGPRVRFVLDAALAAADPVNFHPLTNTATTAVSQAGFRRFLAALGVEPLIVDFAALGSTA